jgi:hypothetical protein
MQQISIPRKSCNNPTYFISSYFGHIVRAHVAKELRSINFKQDTCGIIHVSRGIQKVRRKI